MELVTAPLLSILVPTIASRAPMLDRMAGLLRPQLHRANAFTRHDLVELIVLADNGERAIGAKRNELLDRAAGAYVAFVDDDDLVAGDYVPRILAALGSRPDCVGFRVRRFSDGRDIGEAVHSLALRPFGHNRRIKHPQDPARALYLRTPNHLNPVRRELAVAVRFPEMNSGEDQEYARALLPRLGSEVFVDAYLYDYLYRTPPHRRHERTNEVVESGVAG